MKVIKRDGKIVDFNKNKIVNAILKAMDEAGETNKDIANRIANEIRKLDREQITVEEIQDLVEDKLMNSRLKKTARAYIRYRYDREKNREISSDLQKRYEQLIHLIKGDDEESKKENSNKDTRILSTMRDYIAGFTCREMASKLLLPKDIQYAHENGLIHFHDSDYSPAMPMHNCCLINLEDMLQNGTMIGEVLIEKPHSFRTACTITTQISAAVASSQYGGQTINLAHLVPFVDISRQKIKKEVEKEFKENELSFGNIEILNNIVENRLKQEIADGIQTIQYQLITMSSTNGQSPFCSLFMYLGDSNNKQEEKDLAMLIEEVLRQRINGVKNKFGYPITTAFPKLLYVLDENNITEDSEYWYLTKLAAECSAKRLVPDYISAKKMREIKQGAVFGCMG